mgnify:CR=1 FL=1
MRLRKFKAKDFEGDDVIDLMSWLVRIPKKRKGLHIEEVKKMSPEEVRTEFAKRVNDESLTFSTYTMNNLEKRLTK